MLHKELMHNTTSPLSPGPFPRASTTPSGLTLAFTSTTDGLFSAKGLSRVNSWPSSPHTPGVVEVGKVSVMGVLKGVVLPVSLVVCVDPGVEGEVSVMGLLVVAVKRRSKLNCFTQLPP
jgi:hypothetical protein